jgi:hypothetical protein
VPPPPNNVPAYYKPNQAIDYEVICLPGPSEILPRDLKTLKVKLSVPGPDEECPVALETISTAELTFLPGCTFFQDIPQYTKMTLPCGHSFSAMVIIYSWCKNNMLCPCCRQGLKCKASVKHLPSHFKDQLAAQVSSSLQSERVEDERDNILSLLQMTPITTSFVELADERSLQLIVTFYFRVANETHPLPQAERLFRPANQLHSFTGGRFSMMVPLVTVHTTRGGRSSAVFRPTPQNINILRQCSPDFKSIKITTQMRIRNAGTVSIDSSGIIDIPAAATDEAELSRTPLIHRRVSGYTEGRSSSHSLPILPVSTFELVFGQMGSNVFLNGITWVPDSSHVHVSLHSLPELGVM